MCLAHTHIHIYEALTHTVYTYIHTEQSHYLQEDFKINVFNFMP